MTKSTDYPSPRDFPGDGIHHNYALDRQAAKAKRAPNRKVTRRLVLDGERKYTAYSLDELIEIDGLAHHGRPGMKY